MRERDGWRWVRRRWRPPFPSGQRDPAGHGCTRGLLSPTAQAAASNSGSAKYLASVRWYQELVDSVTAQVVALYPTAYQLEIDGVSPTGPSAPPSA